MKRKKYFEECAGAELERGRYLVEKRKDDKRRTSLNVDLKLGKSGREGG